MKNVNTPYVIIHESEELSIRLFKENRGNIIIKKLNQNTHSFYVNKLLNESEISKNLNFSGVRKVFQIKNKESSPELWLEYIEGKTLATLSKKKKGNIFEFLKIAIGVVNILSNVHETNVIHNNINYDNIIVGSNGQITLIDFGIAFDLNGNIPNQEDFLNHIDLKYSSPEQTGRIKQKVDARSDLYSLGVVLYEMLSGKRLFNFSDKQDLINAHLLTIPEPISDVDKNIPKTISNIISKLIRKNKNDRYQSAKGLLIDLTKCYNQLKEKNIIKEFELDEVGYAENHRIPSTFIGRENQMEVLNEELASLLEKKKTLITISGYSGVGKTRLVKEFINFNKQKEFTFISGKFDQYNRGVPYSGIIESFSRWIDVVLTLEEKKKKELKSRIEVAVGNNGNLLIDLFPKMKFILGQQPTIPKVGHKENKFRLEQVVQNFIGAIATKNNPLILFIDDLQWADASSFELLNTILKSDKDYYCLVIGSFRDNELKIGNNLNKWIVDLKTEHVNHVKIYIEELSLDNIVNLVEKSLDISSDKLKVAIWLHHKTGGNVFFTLELINILYKQNFIKNQKLGTQKWSLSIEEINQLEAPDSIIDLIVAKISKIDQNNLELLKIGACIGKQFDTEVLNYVASTSSAEKSLLSSELDDYLVKSEGGDELLTSYYFVHDKVQEAVYSSLSEKEREHYHYLIGSYYRNQSGYEEINNMFSVARNWNIVNVSKLNEKEKRALIDINLEVGINSLNNVSSENAILYFDKALTLVGQTKGVRKELIEEVMFWSAKADYNNALFDSAEIKLKQLLQTTKSLHNKSEIAIILCQLMQSQGKWEEAVKVGLNILEEHHIQVDFPESELGAQINLNIEKATKLIKAQMKSSSKKTKPLTDTNQLTILKIMNVVVSPVYVIRPQLLPIILSKGVTHSIIHGLSKYSPEFYQIFGRLLLSQREIVIAKYLIDTGFALLEKIDVEEQKCNAIFSYLQNMYWFRPFNYNEKYVIKAFKAAVSVGNVIFGAYIYANDLFETEAKGENLDKLSEKIKEYSTYLERVNNLPMLLLRDTISALIDELKGENKNALDNLVHSPTFDGFDHGIHYFNVKRAWVALLHKRYEQAEHYLELSTKHIHGAFMQYSVIEHQYYSCLVLLKLHPHEVLEKESEKGRIFWDNYNN
ncbi:MAG: AAA family ATPase, partial [Cyclobacteriaceae bacterium]|nr:AAA family ATPase [Cyclobacteriaceae bacterium]